MTMVRAKVMVAGTLAEAEMVKRKYPQFRFYLVITPRTLPTGIQVSAYVSSPAAVALPARQRMAIRGALSSLIDEDSVEETFPTTLPT